MNDFSPEIRATAIWSGDSRRIAKGDACGVVLEKLGRTPFPEPVGEELHMGHILEPVIARIFEDQNQVTLKRLDVALSHAQHPWLQSHFDYIEAEGAFLVECKNYHANYISYFSEPDDPVRVPDDDLAQCLHEAIVANVSTVYLAVLFGGQRYRQFKLEFTPEDKEKWIKRLAEVWGNIQTNSPPPPQTPDQARDLWPTDDSHSIVATKQVEAMVHNLARYKAQHKQNEDAIDSMQTAIMAYMGSRSELVSVDGRQLVTWKQAKPCKRFDSALLKSSMPALYESFCAATEGSRRFLTKVQP